MTYAEPSGKSGAPKIVHSAGPHDCPSTFAPEVERLDARGSVVVHVRPFDGLQPGVVVESVWPNDAFVEGRGINTLTSANAGPPNGGAVFHDTAVWLRRA